MDIDEEFVIVESPKDPPSKPAEVEDGAKKPDEGDAVTEDQPKDEPVDEPKEEPVDQPKDEPEEQPKDEPEEQPKDEPEEQPKDETEEQPKDETEEQPKEEAKEEPKDESVQETAPEEPVLAEVTSEEPAQPQENREESPAPQKDEEPAKEPAAAEQSDKQPEPVAEPDPVPEANGKQPTAEEDPAPAEANGKEPTSNEEEKQSKPDPVLSGAELRQLLVGTDMVKVRGKKYYPRIFRVTEDLLRVIWISRRKSPLKSQIFIGQIQQVTLGRVTRSFQRNTRPIYAEEVCFSIVYQQNRKEHVIDLAAPTQKERDRWVYGLRTLLKNNVSESTSEVRTRWLSKLFQDADRNGNGTLDLKEVLHMMKKLNIGISQKLLKQKFKAVDDGDNSLQFKEFSSLFQEMSDRPEVRRLFALYASGDGFMTCDDLKRFMEEEQGEEEVTSGFCQNVVERFEPSTEGTEKGLLSVDGFVQFLLSPDCDVFRREHRQVYQDMSQPLSHYFIASSHNTYLLEDQLKGPSSVDAYTNALKRGCRCVELDCWDGKGGEPVIYHGHTLTSKILFKDAIVGIKENAFVASPYPLILSIENHCSIQQQHRMAEIMEEIFGDMLHRDPRDETRPHLPSPEELKFKILIKAKKLHKDAEDQDNGDGDVSDEDEAAEIDSEELKKIAPADEPKEEAPTTEETPAKPATDEETPAKPTTDEETPAKPATEETKTKSPSHSQKKVKLSARLSKCVNYIQSVSFKNLEHNTKGPFFHMSSFGESKALKLSDSVAHDFLEYNKIHISRTYPSGRRVDSSNYEPIDMWNCGCQIVALNYQTPGKNMDWNLGKFQQNGNSGYILKPEIMRQEIAHFNHKNRSVVAGVPQKVLTMRIISGQQLPKPEKGSATGEIIDPYVEIQVVGVPIDCAEFKTKVIKDNGFNPVWNESLSHVLHFPELALVRFRVMDSDTLSDDFIGQYTLPFDSIAAGFRHVSLYTSKWEKIPGASLFLHISIGDWIGPPKQKRQKELQLNHPSVKKTRNYPILKRIVPHIDAHYQTQLTSLQLQSAIDLRENYQFALIAFKESAGKSAHSPVFECVETMANIAKTAGISLKFHSRATSHSKLIFKAKATRETGEDVTSGALFRMIALFNELNNAISKLLEEGEKTATKLEEEASTTLNMKPKMEEFIETSPVGGKVAPQIKENFSWCVRTLQSESSCLRESCNVAVTTLQKITTAGEQSGIEVVSEM